MLDDDPESFAAAVVRVLTDGVGPGLGANGAALVRRQFAGKGGRELRRTLPPAVLLGRARGAEPASRTCGALGAERGA